MTGGEGGRLLRGVTAFDSLQVFRGAGGTISLPALSQEQQQDPAIIPAEPTPDLPHELPPPLSLTPTPDL